MLSSFTGSPPLSLTREADVIETSYRRFAPTVTTGFPLAFYREMRRGEGALLPQVIALLLALSAINRKTCAISATSGRHPVALLPQIGHGIGRRGPEEVQMT